MICFMETDFGNKSRDGIKMEFERKSNDVVHVDNMIVILYQYH